jgi:hypothetical protein
MLSASPCGGNGNGWAEAVEKLLIARDKHKLQKQKPPGRTLAAFGNSANPCGPAYCF